MRPASFPRSCRAVLAGAVLALASGGASAQAFDHGLVEETPYVPTPQIVVDTMLGVAKVGRGDYLIDLGSGDGRIVVTAVKDLGARGYGVDINPTLVDFARRYASDLKLGNRARFDERDVLKTPVGDASVITMYLLPNLLEALKPRLFSEPKPGTRIVSHDADFTDWPPDELVTINVPNKPVGPRPESKIRLWIVPARIAGDWRDDAAGSVALVQSYQQVSGTLVRPGGARCPLAGALRGTALRMTACTGDDALVIEADATDPVLLRGTVTDARGNSRLWRAHRAGS
jgi:hypothetical protein